MFSNRKAKPHGRIQDLQVHLYHIEEKLISVFLLRFSTGGWVKKRQGVGDMPLLMTAVLPTRMQAHVIPLLTVSTKPAFLTPFSTAARDQAASTSLGSLTVLNVPIKYASAR
jgi:hypothetical protein